MLSAKRKRVSFVEGEGGRETIRTTDSPPASVTVQRARQALASPLNLLFLRRIRPESVRV
jgi:hypothetical protein